ncbi:MAG: HAMP domain-containing protein [Chloroflexaceae bacterium]|nr:HAMP domain-containing protein [Chloroflexaceae bacterium]
MAQREVDQVLVTLTTELRNVMLILVGMLLLLLTTMAGALWLTQRQIVQPIKQLAVSANAVTAGQFDQQVRVTNHDEIGTLQDSFNTMVASLQTQQQALREQNEALQKEQAALAQAMHELEQGAQERATLQQQVIAAQQATLRELSSPLIPIADQVVVMPLIGAIDSQRAQQILDTLLNGVEQHRAQVAIIDITGVKTVDTAVAKVLLQAAQAIRLLGAQTLLTGIQPPIAQTLVHLGVDMRTIATYSSLQMGVAAAVAARRGGNWSRTPRAQKLE